MNYYDIVLGIIPITLIGTTGILMVAGFQQVIAVFAGALITIGIISHAIFINGPSETPYRPERQGSPSDGSQPKISSSAD